MADYKVIDAEQLDADLTIVADSIRSKSGTTELLEFPLGMKQAVEAIQSGGGSGSSGEFITMTTATTNAQQAYELFKTFFDDSHCYLFVYKGEPVIEGIDKKCLTFIVSYIKSSNTFVGYWVRYNRRSDTIGFINSSTTISADYDLIINVGDVYEKVVLW